MGSNISPSGAAVTISEAGGNTHKFLSGVEWLTVGNVMNIASTCNNVAMKSYRQSNTLLVSWGEFGRGNSWYGIDTCFSGIPNKSSVANINTSDSPLTQFSLGSNRTVSNGDNAKIGVRYYDPHGLSSYDETPYVTDKFRIDTYDESYGTSNLVENFSGETMRFTKNSVDSYLLNNGVTVGNADWDNTLDISAAVGGELSLQVAYNNLIYPSRNYIGTKPVGPDYSGLSGDRTYYRLFQGTGPFNGGRITFAGLSNALSEVQSKSNIEVYLHLPGVGSYQFGGGHENGGIFQDLGVFQNIPGGCLAFTGGSGDYIDFSFGTISSTLSNYKCFIKIKVKNTNITLNSVTFSPTYA